nr:MerR family transcriptional regulator [Candidatus Contubernalis alkalaceticus]
MEQLIRGSKQINNSAFFTRKEAADQLQISMDALRNWEMNGLLTIKRKQNGYRTYSDEDIRLIKIIRSLRCANYSLAAILRMLNALSNNPRINIREVIDTPKENDDIISACDHLLTSLKNAESNANNMLHQLRKMPGRFRPLPSAISRISLSGPVPHNFIEPTALIFLGYPAKGFLCPGRHKTERKPLENTQ